MDVSGIVRKQSFEDFLAEKPSEREKIAENKKPFNGNSNSNSKRESITGMSPSAQRRGSFFDESTRRDKIVSFGVPSPPRIVPSPKNPLRLSIPDATAFTNVNTSPKSLLGTVRTVEYSSAQYITAYIDSIMSNASLLLQPITI